MALPATLNSAEVMFSLPWISAALASDSPTEAISGSQKVTLGTRTSSTGVGSRPAIFSATTMPWAKPRWASWTPGTMSPTAHTPGTLVRPYSSARTKPRSMVTPTSS